MDASVDKEVKRIPPASNRGGVWVQMGLEEYRIPPLGFGALKDIGERMKILQGIKDIPNADQLACVAEIVQLAMKRNYPDITVDNILDMLDMGNFHEVLGAVLATAGYRRAAEGEAQTTSQ